MKTILIVLMAVLLSSCTIYRVQTERDTAGNITVTANIYSSRSFTAPELAYIREGADASFTFGADGTTQPGPQDYAAGVATGIRAMMVPPQ